ncbi:TauD/TfdA dioxygenase family protein [Nocardia australiensis]|uniref:TauD/TfdA dioxygenase family protein n=1 Tax=Nocardia australiensis TaxID=2887191 RepID=UPI001D15DA70|nr:TauD/TfdA family dioxygenase [Nocardia australiensis]
MKISPQPGMGVIAEGFVPGSDVDVRTLKQAAYRHRIVIVKEQHLDPAGLLEFGRRLGTPQLYYEPIYHHPDVPEVFVSSNVSTGGRQLGVPKTGQFWHSDYQFMPRPFDLTIISPRQVPRERRGTLFIDLVEAYRRLDPELARVASETVAIHTPRRKFKIRPDDVYRPIGDVLAEIDTRTPPVRQPTVLRHPRTGEQVLYVTEGATETIEDSAGRPRPDLLEQLLSATGQLDPADEHPVIHLQKFDVGDLLIWDNIALAHRSLHNPTAEPAESWRITVYDDEPVTAL